MEVAYRIYDIVVGLCKDEVALCIAAVDEDSVQSGSTHVSEGIVFASQSFREGCVHVHVLQGVYYRSLCVTEAFVYGPYPDALRNLLV